MLCEWFLRRIRSNVHFQFYLFYINQLKKNYKNLIYTQDLKIIKKQFHISFKNIWVFNQLNTES